MQVLLFALAVAGVLTTPAAADLLTVGPDGSPAPYHAIGDALADADPGDTVLVNPGLYPAFELNEAVRVVGAANVFVAAAGAEPAVRVLGIPLGSEGARVRDRGPEARLRGARCAARSRRAVRGHRHAARRARHLDVRAR
jgi:hypothetical protein